MRKYCQYQYIRHRKYKPYFYCKHYRHEIILQECKNCSIRLIPSYTKIKKKSNKLSKIEKNRFSIIHNDMSVCFFCGKEAETIHELIGGINRLTSIKHGLCVGACLICHRKLEDNEKIKQKYQVFAQEKFEEKYSHDLFMQEFKMDYKIKYERRNK